MGDRKRPTLVDVLRTVKTEMHVIVNTLPQIDGFGLFTNVTLRGGLTSRISESRLEEIGLVESARNPIYEACHDLVNSGVFRRFNKSQLIKDGIEVPKDGTREVYIISPFSATQYFYLCAMYALAFEDRTGISIYNILGRYDSKRERRYGLDDWLQLLVDWDEKRKKGEVVTVEQLAQNSRIPYVTIHKRLRRFEELGYIRKMRVGQEQRYMVKPDFVKAIRGEKSEILRDLYKMLTDKDVVERDAVRDQLKYFTVTSLVELLQHKYKYISVQRIITKLKRMGLISEVKNKELPKNVSHNGTIVVISEKGEPIFEEFAPVLLNSYRERNEPRLVEKGIGYFKNNGGIDLERYKDAVVKALRLYVKANPNIH